MPEALRERFFDAWFRSGGSLSEEPLERGLEAALEQLREELKERFEQNAARCREVASGEPEGVAHTLAVAAETWDRAKATLDSILGDKEDGR